MPDETDAKNILTASPLENWRPPGCSCIMWMKTIQQDLKSNNLSLNQEIGMAQKCPLWRLMILGYEELIPMEIPFSSRLAVAVHC